MGKKILICAVQFICCVVSFALFRWLFSVVFDGDSSFSYEILLQAVIFSFLFVPFSCWRNRGKQS